MDRLRAAQIGSHYANVDRYRDFRRVFLGSHEGRRVLWQILSWCRLYGTTFDPESSRRSAFYEGKRDLGLQIMNTMNAAPAEELGERAITEDEDQHG